MPGILTLPVASVELIVNGTTAGIKTASPYQWEINTLTGGDNTLTLRTTDNEGATTDNPRLISLAEPGAFINPLSRSDWILSSSNNNSQTGRNNLPQAIDGNLGTRWGTQTVQVPGMFFQIDLQRERAFKAIRLDAATNPDDYPRGYRILGSNDNADFDLSPQALAIKPRSTSF